MSVVKSITVSDDLYAQIAEFLADHPDCTFNQLCREGLKLRLQETICVTAAPISTIR